MEQERRGVTLARYLNDANYSLDLYDNDIPAYTLRIRHPSMTARRHKCVYCNKMIDTNRVMLTIYRRKQWRLGRCQYIHAKTCFYNFVRDSILGKWNDYANKILELSHNLDNNLGENE